MAPFWHCSSCSKCFASERGLNIHITLTHDTGNNVSDYPDENYINFLDPLAEDFFHANNELNELNEDNMIRSSKKRIRNSANETKNDSGKQSKKRYMLQMM